MEWRFEWRYQRWCHGLSVWNAILRQTRFIHHVRTFHINPFPSEMQKKNMEFVCAHFCEQWLHFKFAKAFSADDVTDFISYVGLAKFFFVCSASSSSSLLRCSYTDAIIVSIHLVRTLTSHFRIGYVRHSGKRATNIFRITELFISWLIEHDLKH